MLTKDRVKELVDHMPESFSADDLIEKIIIMQKIDIAEDELNRGEGTDWEDVKKEMDTWF